MKKLEKISAIMIVVGLGISIFSVAFLDANVIVGFAGLIISLCSAFTNICIRDKRKKANSKKPTERSILKSNEIPSSADDAATDIAYKLNKTFKWDFISDTVNYLYDSQISLSELKNRCLQNGSNITKELTDKDSGWQEFIDGFFQMIKENGLFFESGYSAFSEVYDGINSEPKINWIKLKENADLNDAVDYYIDIKKYIDSYSANRLCIYRDTYYNFHWLYKTTFLILNDNKSELTDEEKNSLFEKCNENNIYIVKQNHDEFTDLFTSTKYTLICSTVPGMADDAATYALYDLMKTYNEKTTREEKISEKILYQLLNYSRSSGVGSAQYREDISLNQINMQIQLDESRLYFLSVYVNASNGMIKHFSFDIESASDTHYEFDLNGAEFLINRMISVSGDEYASHKSISKLMIEYINSFGESSLIDLIREVATSVFHFD